LHIAGTDLEHIRVPGHQGDLFRRHHFGHYGQARDLPGFGQVFQALLAQPLEGIRRGARLEGTAPQHLGARFLHRVGRLQELRAALHRTGAGDDDDVRTTKGDRTHPHQRVLRMELP